MTLSQHSPAETDAAESLAYALSHDLRARLRAANGFLELARADLHADADAGRLLERAAAAAALADRMVQRLVVYLRLRPVADIAAVDPTVVIREAAGRLPDGPELIVGSLPRVLADGELLAMVVTEILDNAVTCHREGHPPTVRVTGAVEGCQAALRFADNGFGISADRVDRAFELFRQVHRVDGNPGSGMGLPIARLGIERMGGSISLGPGVDGGAVVEIRLPAPLDA